VAPLALPPPWAAPPAKPTTVAATSDKLASPAPDASKGAKKTSSADGTTGRLLEMKRRRQQEQEQKDQDKK
jgi:hypothetical protein